MTDEVIAATILRLTRSRAAGATVCPSEVARVLADDDGWRALMPAVRRVAGRLQCDGLVRATQRGRPVDPESARGPIRLGRP